MTLNLEKLILDVFNPKEGERVFLLNDFPSDFDAVSDTDKTDYVKRRDMVILWYSALKSLSSKKGFEVEDIITYEPTDQNGAPLPQTALQNGKVIDLPALMDSWGERDIVLGITKYSPTGPIFNLIENCGKKFRAATMPGATMDMSAFEADYNIVERKAHILADEINKATYAKVTYTTGEICYFDLRGRKAHPDDGQCTQPGQAINLPSGEAYIAPYEGLDSALGPSFTKGELPVMYGNELVIYVVNEGKIESVTGNGEKAEEMRAFFEVDPARRYIAEFALGCNDKAVFCGRILQDEKIEGHHWAYGANNHLGGVISPDKFTNPLNVVHQDCIYASSAPIGIRTLNLGTPNSEWVIMKDSKFLLGEPFN